MNKTIKTSILTVALATGGLTAGSLVAQATDDGGTPDGGDDLDIGSPVEGLRVVDSDAGDDADSDDSGADADAARRRGHRSEAIAEALGMTTDELRAAKNAGQTIAEIADARGVPTDDVIDALVDATAAHLADKVEAGELTQAEADEKLAGAADRAEALINREPGARGPRGVRGDGRAAVAEALGLTTDELRDARRAGDSLADIAAAQGVSIDAVVDVIVERAETRLTERVEAGELTQAEADERATEIAERADERVNADPQERTGRRGPRQDPATVDAPTDAGN